jgi:hypothetical protein
LLTRPSSMGGYLVYGVYANVVTALGLLPR